MKTQVVSHRAIVAILIMMSLIYGVQSISYGQVDSPTVTPGETNTSLVVRFQITLDEGVDENAYQIQVKSPSGEWLSKCIVIKRGIRHEAAGDPDVFASAIYISGPIFHFGDWSDETFNIRSVFTNLEPGTTHEVRYRDTNQSECAQNPLAPDPWSETGKETTHLVTPPRVEFVDVDFAMEVRKALGLNTVGGDIELLKIPQASLAGLIKLELSDNKITDITGLEHATQLRELDLSDNHLINITPLAKLVQLTDLDLSDNQISDITPLSQLIQLTDLELDRNEIGDITPLAQLAQLTELQLWDNQIGDVSSLTTFASIESLGYISLSGNPIADISPVRKLKREHPNLSISIDKPVILTDAGEEPDLYVIADNRYLYQFDLNRINVQEIGTDSLNTYDIAIDVIDDRIYWATRDDIQRANLDGTDVQDVVTGLDEPEDIAIDISGGKIYWTEERDSRIQRANLDGTNVQDAISGLYRPYGIAIDVPGGKIYWMEEDDHRIRRANLDGTNVQDVVTGLNEPEDIALDVSSGKIYWTEPSEDRIQRANLDGSDVHIVFHDLDSPRGITLDIAGDKIYWTDYYNNEIWRANLDGSDIHVVAIGVSSPIAIALDSDHTGMQNEQSVSPIVESPSIPEDVNGDDVVNILDLVLVASNLGDEGTDLAADVNGDGIVNILDLVLVAGALGNAAAAPSSNPQALVMLNAADVEQWLAQAQTLDLTDATSQRGVLFLKQLLAALTPKETALLPNYPNPFNPETWIPYQLAENADVTLTIYDTKGVVLRRLELGHRLAGYYADRGRAAYWNGCNDFGEKAASGVYFYHLSAGDYSAARKMLIRK